MSKGVSFAFACLCPAPRWSDKFHGKSRFGNLFVKGMIETPVCLLLSAVTTSPSPILHAAGRKPTSAVITDRLPVVNLTGRIDYGHCWYCCLHPQLGRTPALSAPRGRHLVMVCGFEEGDQHENEDVPYFLKFICSAKNEIYNWNREKNKTKWLQDCSPKKHHMNQVLDDGFWGADILLS